MREDYGPKGDAWTYLSHDLSRSFAYRWGEDGIAGVSDDSQTLCFALALWNGRDPILKERLFGLTNPEGNHGEDVKEYYFYLDSTPTHSYMRYLYKYPQAAFPYRDLVDTNARRTRAELEYELIDTGVFADDAYFDVVVDYAKAGPEDLLIEISASNRGPRSGDAAPASDVVVPEHLVAGKRRERRGWIVRSFASPAASNRRWRPPAPSSASICCAASQAPRFSSPTTRPTPRVGGAIPREPR